MSIKRKAILSILSVTILFIIIAPFLPNNFYDGRRDLNIAIPNEILKEVAIASYFNVRSEAKAVEDYVDLLNSDDFQRATITSTGVITQSSFGGRIKTFSNDSYHQDVRQILRLTIINKQQKDYWIIVPYLRSSWVKKGKSGDEKKVMRPLLAKKVDSILAANQKMH